MKCLRCGSKERVKNGKVGERQRYKCKGCDYSYTRSERRGYSMTTKLHALALYKEGLGFRAIGRLLGVSNVSILNWIRDFGKDMQSWYDGKFLATSGVDIPVLEIDEMWHFVEKNSKNSGYGLLIALPQNVSLPLKLALVKPKP